MTGEWGVLVASLRCPLCKGQASEVYQRPGLVGEHVTDDKRRMALVYAHCTRGHRFGLSVFLGFVAAEEEEKETS